MLSGERNARSARRRRRSSSNRTKTKQKARRHERYANDILDADCGCGLLAATVPVAGHHAFGAEFDPDAPIRLQGKVVKLEWVNPHAWIHIEVTKPDGTKEVWMVEGGTPNTLLRRGLTRDC